jgi:polar amino acid transport system ATP-binding protein
MITCENITLTVQNKQILNNASCTFEKDEITVILGSSGAGKTSLLKCIAQLHAYEGTITFDGKNIAEFSEVQRAHHIGFVFQHFNLFPHMTVLGQCMHAVKNCLKLKTNEAQKRAMEALSQVNLEKFIHRYPSQLSGGQQQRVALARALALQPKVLLFDEPTSALDPAATQSFALLLQQLKKEGTTIVVSSHDGAFVDLIKDRCYVLEVGKIRE